MSKGPSLNDFGLLIAYVLPGFTALWAATYLTDALDPWLGSAPADSPTVGGFLYLIVAAIAAGLTVSTIRWLVIDTLHHRTGVPPPAWNFAALRSNAAEFNLLVEIHYRYYQFHANMFVSLAFIFVARRVGSGASAVALGWLDAGLILLGVVFFLGSRDSLHKYYTRAGQLLQAEKGASLRGLRRRGRA